MKKIFQFLFRDSKQKKDSLNTPEDDLPKLPENVELYLLELYKKKEYELLALNRKEMQKKPLKRLVLGNKRKR